MRKHYIDNIRTICILLLFPFHTCVVYSKFEEFYVYVKGIQICSDFIAITYLWFMPMLFVLAGMSTFIALERRTNKEYTIERVKKLLVPLLFGIILIIPVQTFFAEKYHNNYTGTYLYQYVLFFTKQTDLTGYKGGFTPGHLWFILFLFVISLISLPAIKWINKKDRKLIDIFLKPYTIILLFVFPFLFGFILDIAGKSVGQFFSLFILGYIIIKYEYALDMIEKNKLKYLLISIVSIMMYFAILRNVDWTALSTFALRIIIYKLISNFASWVIILAIIGYSKKYLNTANSVTKYFRNASFPLYIVHQSWLIAITYYVVQYIYTDVDYYDLQLYIKYNNL